MPTPRAERPFIGRVHELGRLDHGLAQTVAGRGAVVVIGGDSGVGKSRLVDEFVNRAQQRGAQVLKGRCVDFCEVGPPYRPVLEALRPVWSRVGAAEPSLVPQALAPPSSAEALAVPQASSAPRSSTEASSTEASSTEASSTEASLLAPSSAIASALTPPGPATLGPSASDLLELPISSGLDATADDPPTGPTPFFELTVRVLRRRAEEVPVVLVIEDIQWADRSTWDLLAFLLANLHRDRVMVIVTHRGEALGARQSLPTFRTELRRGRRAEFLVLRPFTRPEMAAQLEGILGRPPEDDLVVTIWTQSNGNPLFAEELVAALPEGYDNGHSPTLRQVLRHRFDVLPEPARQLLQLVATAPDGVSLAVLAEVSELSDSDLVESARPAVEHQLLVVTTDGWRYQFRHSLMQEVVYDALSPRERQRLHAAFGQALGRPGRRTDASAAAELACHWYAAGDASRALVAAVDAAGAAAGIYGLAEAQELYRRAIELWDQVANASGVAGLARSDLFERAAEVAHRAGEPRRASALMAAALAEPDVSAGETAPAGLRSDRGGTADPGAIAAAGGTVDAGGIAAAGATADPGGTDGTGGIAADPGGTDGTGGEGISPGGPLSREAAIRRAVRQQRLGRYLWVVGDSRDALRAYQEAVRCLPAGEASAERASVEGALAEALMWSGRYRVSCQQAEAALKAAREVGARLEESHILATLGYDLVFLGDAASGLAALERALVIAEELGNPDDIGRMYLRHATLLSGPLNRVAEAVEVAERGVARLRQLGLERTYGAALQAAAVTMLFRRGRWSEADDLVQQARAATPTGTAAIDLSLAQAELSVERGQFEAAEADLTAVETLARAGFGAQYEAPLLTLRARLDLWLGRAIEARDAVSRGIVVSVNGGDDVWLLAPLIWHGLRAEAELAEAARARGDKAALATSSALATGLWAQAQSLTADGRSGATPLGRSIEAYLCLCQGEAARADGRPEPEIWAEAARRWRELREPYAVAYADWRHAEALLALHSRSSRAAELLRAAHQVAVRLGATPLRRQVEGLAGRARLVLDAAAVEPRSQSADGVVAQNAAKERYGLSSRELEVWLRLPEGLTNNQIGELLFISGKTASVHVTNILRKLGVRSRVQAITLAHQLGLVDVDGSGE